MMTVVVPLSAFFMIISEFDLNSLSALRSLKGKLFCGLIVRLHDDVTRAVHYGFSSKESFKNGIWK